MIVLVPGSDPDPDLLPCPPTPSVWAWAQLCHLGFLWAVELSGGNPDNRRDALTPSASFSRRVRPVWTKWVHVPSEWLQMLFRSLCCLFLCEIGLITKRLKLMYELFLLSTSFPVSCISATERSITGTKSQADTRNALIFTAINSTQDVLLPIERSDSQNNADTCTQGSVQACDICRFMLKLWSTWTLQQTVNGRQSLLVRESLMSRCLRLSHRQDFKKSWDLSRKLPSGARRAAAHFTGLLSEALWFVVSSCSNHNFYHMIREQL